MPDTMAPPRTARTGRTTLRAPVLSAPAPLTLPDRPALALAGTPALAQADSPARAGATSIQLVQVPDTAPRYDDDGHLADPPGALGAGDPGLPFPAPASDPHGRAALSMARPLAAGSAAAPRSPSGHWPSQFAQILAETLAGLRPASQLAPWTTNRSRRRISQLGSALATPHRPRVRRVIVTSPASGVLEMSIIAVFGNRVRALAVRLERTTPASTTNPAPGNTTSDASDPPTPAPSATEAAAAGSASPAAGWCCTAIEAA